MNGNLSRTTQGLSLVYQPIIKIPLENSATDDEPEISVPKISVIGFEALGRLRQGGELISIFSLIQEAEKCGDKSLLQHIDLIVLEQCLQDLGLIQDSPSSVEGFSAQDLLESGFYLAINVSAHSWDNKAFFNKLADAKKTFPDLPKFLRFELVETASLPIRYEVALLAKLYALGFSIAIDDCGAGSHATTEKISSLLTMHNLCRTEQNSPTIKLDREAVVKPLEEGNASALELLNRFFGVATDSLFVFEGCGLSSLVVEECVETMGITNAAGQSYEICKPQAPTSLTTAIEKLQLTQADR
jgi:EAL domain-containing protein (putative c-di-GMP-specific phosphodiesterase class I)